MKKETLYIFIIGISLAGYGWLGWNVIAAHEQYDAPTVCMVKTITGLPCPSCGTTRSLTELVERNLSGSLHANPFGIMVAAMLFVFPLWVITDQIRGDDSFFRRYVSMERILSKNKWVFAASVLLVAANWYWNIAKGL